ncbi:MAG TPA: hypothetical protein VFE47_09275 [Tepidisphaeraceae bacterium]|jgi:hypothetical protein|nr:hypothetical protein [Tepidisphaeraceae bacterium]
MPEAPKQLADPNAYHHTQRAPLYLLFYAIAIAFLVVGVALRGRPPFPWMFPVLAAVMAVLAGSMHNLTVKDHGERLLIGFGPIPLFRRSVRYRDIASVEAGRTRLLDGWGIHVNLSGGWVWNIWGRDCVVVHLKNGGVLRIGTDDREHLTQFLANRLRIES